MASLACLHPHAPRHLTAAPFSHQATFPYLRNRSPPPSDMKRGVPPGHTHAIRAGLKCPCTCARLARVSADYVLHEPAGSSDKAFSNGVRDAGRNGERLADFVNHPSAKRAGLREAHVLALRLYTTATFRSINGPLRDHSRTTPHPFAATVFFLTDGIRRLRTIAADAEYAEKEEKVRHKRNGLSRLSTMTGGTSTDLWRGMANMGATEEFEHLGGSEPAPMSTTHDPAVAIAYGSSSNALLFKIVAASFMNRGADLTFLSAFPEEREFLYACAQRALSCVPGKSALCFAPHPHVPVIARQLGHASRPRIAHTTRHAHHAYAYAPSIHITHTHHASRA